MSQSPFGLTIQRDSRRVWFLSATITFNLQTMFLNNSKFDLTIIQPCYNPPANWAFQLNKHFQQLVQLLPPETRVELIIVNDGSTANFTETDIAYLKEQIPHFSCISYAQNRGKGYALRSGVQQANAPYIIYTDIDFPYRLENMVAVYEDLLRGADVVAGVRDQRYYDHLSLKRKITSKACKFLNEFLLDIHFYDTQSGIKGFNRFGKAVFLETTIDRFLFDTEFLSMVDNTDLYISTVEITLREEVTFSHMSLRVIVQELFNFAKIYQAALLRKLSFVKAYTHVFKENTAELRSGGV